MTRRSGCDSSGKVSEEDSAALAGEIVQAYRDSLPYERRYLLDRFTFVDVVRQVVGVGSVGMQVYLVLLEGRGRRRSAVPADQAGRSVGVRAVPRTQPVPEPWAAGDHRETADPGGERHLRRLDERAGSWTSTYGNSAT